MLSAEVSFLLWPLHTHRQPCLKASADMQALKATFARPHGYSSPANLVAFLALAFHGLWIGNYGVIAWYNQTGKESSGRSSVYIVIKKYACRMSHGCRNIRCDNYAPTLSRLGRKPSFKCLSKRRISSTEVAFAIASLTLFASSLVKSLPALPGATTVRGSSAIVTFFAAPVDTVVDIVVARAFMSPSAVKNKLFAACLSYNSY
jgi:hypothetical protein